MKIILNREAKEQRKKLNKNSQTYQERIFPFGQKFASIKNLNYLSCCILLSFQVCDHMEVGGQMDRNKECGFAHSHRGLSKEKKTNLKILFFNTHL